MAKTDISGAPAQGANLAETVRDITQKTAGFQVVEVEANGVKVPLVGRLRDNTLEYIDLKGEADKWRAQPERVEGTATAQTLDSFISLIDWHKGRNSVIFAQVTSSPNLTAVIDYHKESLDDARDRAQFCKHRISYSFPLSEEWKTWSGANGKMFKQAEFASFIEDHIYDLSILNTDDVLDDVTKRYIFANPSELLTLARGLEINASARVKNIVNLQSGEAQIAFEEEHKDAFGGALKVPGAFMLSIPLFDGGDIVRIAARLRYRKAETGLTWFFDIYRMKAVLRAQVVADMEKAANATNLPAFIGTPEC